MRSQCDWRSKTGPDGLIIWRPASARDASIMRFLQFPKSSTRKTFLSNRVSINRPKFRRAFEIMSVSRAISFFLMRVICSIVQIETNALSFLEVSGRRRRSVFTDDARNRLADRIRGEQGRVVVDMRIALRRLHLRVAQ